MGMLWRYIQWGSTFTPQVEELRRWGSKCCCHTEDYLARMAVECDQKSRRLHEASERVATFMSNLKQFTRGITYTSCEEDMQLHARAMIISNRCLADSMEKTAWIDDVPYLFVNLDTPVVAAEILRQWRSVDKSGHHDKTIEVMEAHEANIVKIAGGDVANIPGELLFVRDRLRRCPLSSKPSEGSARRYSAPNPKFQFLIAGLEFRNPNLYF